MNITGDFLSSGLVGRISKEDLAMLSLGRIVAEEDFIILERYFTNLCKFLLIVDELLYILERPIML